jgi:dTDP-4-amino-4,6-dideoxygalactose transaminase
VPLHSSPAGKRYGRVHGSLEMTTRQSERLIRLPLWVGLSPENQGRVVKQLVHSVDRETLNKPQLA